MGLLFTAGLLIYYLFFLKRRGASRSPLSLLLWQVYFALGVAAAIIGLTGALQPVYAPNYLSVLFLLLCVCISIAGFLSFRAQDAAALFGRIGGQRILENVLIGSQFLAILFFLPFAMSSLTGDVNENRLQLTERMEALGSFGLINTVAGAATQLFSTSLLLAFIRLSSRPGNQRHVLRSALLFLGSLSYVVYILAYVGRDGVVYWAMTAAAAYLIFRAHLSAPDRARIVALGSLVSALLLIPFLTITIARFVDTESGLRWSFLEYFGAQINHFSDYSTIDRPTTFGVLNFPMAFDAVCAVAGIGCESWQDIKELIFALYLAQDKEPWLFGTFVSDFVADFEYAGAIVLVVLLALAAHWLCAKSRRPDHLTLARLMLIFFLYLVPLWGVFYFRFSIANGFIVINLMFIGLAALLNRLAPGHGGRHGATWQGAAR